MKRFIEGADRTQSTLLPACIDDYVAEDNPVRVIEAFVDELVWASWGLEEWSLRQPEGRAIGRRRC